LAWFSCINGFFAGLFTNEWRDGVGGNKNILRVGGGGGMVSEQPIGLVDFPCVNILVCSCNLSGWGVGVMTVDTLRVKSTELAESPVEFVRFPGGVGLLLVF
jgi:hypothetical protein